MTRKMQKLQSHIIQNVLFLSHLVTPLLETKGPQRTENYVSEVTTFECLFGFQLDESFC